MTVFESLDRTAHRMLVEAYLASVGKTLSRISKIEVTRLLESYDLQTIIEQFSIGPDDLIPLQDAVEDAFHLAGTTYIVSDLPARFKQIAFDRRHLRAEQAIKQEGGRLIADISADSRASIQQAVMRGLRQGSSSSRVAQDIAGTFNRATQTRQGGIIGLSNVQRQWADSAAEELASLNPNYLTRKLRDKRYDPLFKKALREGRPLRTDEIMKLTQRYRDKLLRYRAETIARTETHTALNMGRYEKVMQTAERAGLDASAVTAIWRASNDARTRDTHGAMRGQRRTAGQPFRTGDGYALRYPGDRSLGAPAAEIINCRCSLTFKVDLG